MYAFLIDETGKVIDYQPTTYNLIKAEVERPALPENPKPGTNYVEYWDTETQQIVLREEARSLTLEEKLDSVDKKADAAMEAIAEVYEGK